MLPYTIYRLLASIPVASFPEYRTDFGPTWSVLRRASFSQFWKYIKRFFPLLDSTTVRLFLPSYWRFFRTVLYKLQEIAPKTGVPPPHSRSNYGGGTREKLNYGGGGTREKFNYGGVVHEKKSTMGVVHGKFSTMGVSHWKIPTMRGVSLKISNYERVSHWKNPIMGGR